MEVNRDDNTRDKKKERCTIAFRRFDVMYVCVLTPLKEQSTTDIGNLYPPPE